MAFTPQQFGQIIKQKHPGAYDDMDDEEVAAHVIDRYPVYKNAVEEKSTFFGRLGDVFKERGKEFMETAKETKEHPSMILTGETAVRTAGDVIGLAGDVIGAAIEPAVEPVITKLAETDLGQKAFAAIGGGLENWDAWKQESSGNQRFGEVVESLVNIADLVGVKKVATFGIKEGMKIAERTGLDVVGKQVKTFAEEATEKAILKKGEFDVKRSVETYEQILGTNKKQTNAVTDFKQKFGESLPEYLVKTGIPLNTSPDGKQFLTKELADNFQKEASEILETSLQDVLQAHRGAGYVDLEDMASQAKKAIDGTPNIPAVTAQVQKGLIDSLFDAEIKKFGSIVDPPIANRVKRSFWNLGYEILGEQGAKAARQAGRVIKERIEKLVGDPVVTDINNELAKVADASDFLRTINGDAVKGGRLGETTTRIIGAMAGSSLGPVGTIVGMEGLVRIVSKLKDVERLSTKAIKRLKDAGVIPSYLEKPEQARQYLQKLMEERGLTKKLPAGAIPARAPKGGAELLTQEEAAKIIRPGKQVPRPGQPALPAGPEGGVIEVGGEVASMPTAFEQRAQVIGGIGQKTINDLSFDEIIEGLNSGGITFDWVKKQSLGGEPLISVGPFPERSLVTESAPTQKMLAEYIEKNRDLLEKEGFTLGGWYDTSSGQTYIDVAVVVPKAKQEAAIELAKKSNQKAVFDLEKFEEINTGGTGEKLDNMSSFEERLKEAEQAIRQDKK